MKEPPVLCSTSPAPRSTFRRRASLLREPPASPGVPSPTTHVTSGEARLVFREAARPDRERSGAAALLRSFEPDAEGHSTSALPSSGISLPHDVLLHPTPGELVSSRSASMGFPGSERRLDRPCGRPGHHASSLSRIRAAGAFRRSRPVRSPHQGFLPACDGAVFSIAPVARHDVHDASSLALRRSQEPACTGSTLLPGASESRSRAGRMLSAS